VLAGVAMCTGEHCAGQWPVNLAAWQATCSLIVQLLGVMADSDAVTGVLVK